MIATDVHQPIFARFFVRPSRGEDEYLDVPAGGIIEVGAGNGLNRPHFLHGCGGDG